jgi:capsular polysaccharide biosynthesis protein
MNSSGLGRYLGWAKGMARQFVNELTYPVRRRTHILDHIHPDRHHAEENGIKNFQVLIPAQTVRFAEPARDSFVRISKYFRDGTFDRPDIFVCEVIDGYFHVGSGLVCTRDFKAVSDLYRLRHYSPFGKKRPDKVTPRAGLFATVNTAFALNHYGWFIDCLPRMHSLAQAYPSERLTILMPDTAGEIMREGLACILPSHFTVEYLPRDMWLQPERMAWPSAIASRGNGFLPTEYLDAIRQPIFRKLGLPARPALRDRLYIPRWNVPTRRVLNETALIALLERYDFKTFPVENLSFREQVETFHRAAIVLGPHGAGLHLIGYSGPIDVVVLHPNRTPENYFHTQAKSLGQNYHYVLTRDSGSEQRNFEVDLAAVEKLLREELGLTPNSCYPDRQGHPNGIRTRATSVKGR